MANSRNGFLVLGISLPFYQACANTGHLDAGVKRALVTQLGRSGTIFRSSRSAPELHHAALQRPSQDTSQPLPRTAFQKSAGDAAGAAGMRS